MTVKERFEVRGNDEWYKHIFAYTYIEKDMGMCLDNRGIDDLIFRWPNFIYTFYSFFIYFNYLINYNIINIPT